MSKDLGINIINKKFGEWTVLRFSHHKISISKTKNKTHKAQMYECICSCGNKSIIRKTDIMQGKSLRCIECRLNKFKEHNKNRSYDHFGVKNNNWRGSKDIPQTYFSQIRSGAKKRNVEFNISIDDLQELWDIQEGKCFYTGINLVFKRNRRKGKYKIKTEMYTIEDNFASLDRLDSSKPYQKDNIKWVWKAVNLMKMAHSHDNFLYIVELIQAKCGEDK